MLSAPATIMVVDDERHLRESLVELFSVEGYTVLEASDGDQALDLLRSAPALPDVVFLDLKMPGRDGIATLQEIVYRRAIQWSPAASPRAETR